MASSLPPSSLDICGHHFLKLVYPFFHDCPLPLWGGQAIFGTWETRPITLFLPPPLAPEGLFFFPTKTSLTWHCYPVHAFSQFLPPLLFESILLSQPSVFFPVLALFDIRPKVRSVFPIFACFGPSPLSRAILNTLGSVPPRV